MDSPLLALTTTRVPLVQSEPSLVATEVTPSLVGEDDLPANPRPKRKRSSTHNDNAGFSMFSRAYKQHLQEVQPNVTAATLRKILRHLWKHAPPEEKAVRCLFTAIQDFLFIFSHTLHFSCMRNLLNWKKRKSALRNYYCGFPQTLLMKIMSTMNPNQMKYLGTPC